MAKICLFVERGLVQAERVDDIDNGLGLVIGVLGSFLGRGVGTNVCMYRSESFDIRGVVE